MPSLGLEQFLLTKLQVFLLYLTRVGALVTIAPVFSSPRLPGRVKISLVFLLAVLVYLPDFSRPIAPLGWGGGLVVALAKEVGTGLLLGFTVAAIFSAFQMAGELIGLEMGLGISRVFNPATGGNDQVLGQFLEMMAILIFLSVNGHHWILEGLAMSFRGIPPGTFPNPKGTVDGLVHSYAEIITIAARLAIPALVLLFVASVGIAILAKTVPQIHMLDMGYPLRILTGFAVLALLVPYMFPMIRELFAEARAALFTVAGSP